MGRAPTIAVPGLAIVVLCPIGLFIGSRKVDDQHDVANGGAQRNILRTTFLFTTILANKKCKFGTDCKYIHSESPPQEVMKALKIEA